MYHRGIRVVHVRRTRRRRTGRAGRHRNTGRGTAGRICDFGETGSRDQSRRLPRTAVPPVDVVVVVSAAAADVRARSVATDATGRVGPSATSGGNGRRRVAGHGAGRHGTRETPTVIGVAANERPIADRERRGVGADRGDRGRGRGAVHAGRARGHAHAGRADPVRQAPGRGAHRGRVRVLDTGRPAHGHRRHVPGRALRHAARRLQPVRAHPHPVALGRRPHGRRPGPRVPATLTRRVQRDGGPEPYARGPARLPQASAAVPAQPVRRLPVPEHLRPVPRSVTFSDYILDSLVGGFDGMHWFSASPPSSSLSRGCTCSQSVYYKYV